MHRLRPSRVGAIDPALRRMLVLLLVIIIGCQMVLHLIDFDAPFGDPITRARHKLAIGKSDDALQMLQLYTHAYPDRPRGWLALGDCLVTRLTPDALDQAVSAYHQASSCQAPRSVFPEALPQDPAALGAASEALLAVRQGGLLALARGDEAGGATLLLQAVAGGDEIALRVLALRAVTLGAPKQAELLQDAVLKRSSDPALVATVAAFWLASPTPQKAKSFMNQVGPTPESLANADAWTCYAAARMHALVGDDALAAGSLRGAIPAIDPRHLESTVTFTRAEIAADPAFHAAGPDLRSVIALWPTHAPLPGRQ